MVLGAGRGPLVERSFRAAKRSFCTLTVFAVDKNPTAIVEYVEKKY
jgi:hypothetical protein